MTFAPRAQKARANVILRRGAPKDPELDRPTAVTATSAGSLAPLGMTARGASLAGALLLSASVITGAAPKMTAAPTNSCTACKERRPTLDPAKFQKGYEAEVAEGYAIAKKYAATLDRIHCYCECAESPMFHHKTLLTCYTDMHAAGCGICLSEARLAAQLKEKGVSDAEIKVTVESVHRTDGHPPTP